MIVVDAIEQSEIAIALATARPRRTPEAFRDRPVHDLRECGRRVAVRVAPRPPGEQASDHQHFPDLAQPRMARLPIQYSWTDAGKNCGEAAETVY